MERFFVTFEQAEFLKSKGFDVPCVAYYHIDEHEKDSEPIETDKKFKNSEIGGNSFVAPEQWQVVEWLRTEHGIWISVYTMDKWHINGNDKEQLFDYSIKQMKLGLIDIPKKPEEFDTPQEAYSAAFNHILKELL